jgi:UDP-3-O-[3-hydroxymyristoyl] glucosamine N-acyltransferase
MEFTLAQIAHILGGELKGNGQVKVNRVGKIEEGGEGAITFLSNPKYEPFIYKTTASAVIVSKDFKPKGEISAGLILVDDPYLSFTALLEEYHKLVSFQKSGVEQPCFFSETASEGKNTYRGAFSYIGNNVKLGDNVKIYPNAYLGDDVIVGNNTIIYAGAKIYARTKIGDYCTIHSGAVIGSDGFGFAPQADGSYKTIPQVGNVVLEDHVSIGANTTIDCATFDSTIIREGVKLDNLIQIGHNVEIGKHTVIASQTGISGSSKVGEYSMIGGQVGLAGHIQLGAHTKIAAQSGINKTIKEEGKILFGSPAFDHLQYMKSAMLFKRLPELNQKIRELEEKIINLTSLKTDDEH